MIKIETIFQQEALVSERSRRKVPTCILATGRLGGGGGGGGGERGNELLIEFAYSWLPSSICQIAH